MKNYLIILLATTILSLLACSSDKIKSGTGDTAKKDTASLDSYGGDGTAKSRIGTTKDSTIMGTPPEKKN